MTYKSRDEVTLMAVPRGYSPSFRNDHDRMWTTPCDGMPKLSGCGQEIETTRPFVKPGLKSSGWYVCYGVNNDGSDDRSYILAFCPDCTKVVLDTPS